MIEENKDLPTFFVRYEDLVKDPKPVLEDLFKFILEQDSLEGTFIEKRIKETVEKGEKATTMYKLKDNH